MTICADREALTAGGGDRSVLPVTTIEVGRLSVCCVGWSWMMQCAAVRNAYGAITVAPQNCPSASFAKPGTTSAAMNGYASAGATVAAHDARRDAGVGGGHERERQRGEEGGQSQAHGGTGRQDTTGYSRITSPS